MVANNKNDGLYTTWGKQLNKECPWSEYPRPQLARGNWQNLNGIWEYAIVAQQNAPLPQIFDGEILVPFSPESLLSGVERQLQPGQTLWYRRSIVFQNQSKQPIKKLHFGAVDQICTVYLDGQEIGFHSGGFWPFSIDISDFQDDGEHVLTIAVRDDSNIGMHAFGKQSLKRGGMWYTAQSGIWQTVWIEYLPLNYVNELKITPMYDDEKVIMQLSTVGQETCYEISICEDGKLISQGKTSCGEIVLDMGDFKSWHPKHPFLYDVYIEGAEDKVQSYFGMRKFSIKNDKDGHPRFTLNGEIIFHNGLLDQGYWSDGMYTPPSDEAMQWELQNIKGLGYNMLRKHIKIEPLRWYYHCDRIGILVWQDFINGGTPYNKAVTTFTPLIGMSLKDKYYKFFGRKSKLSRDLFEKEAKATVDLLHNTTAIAVWVLFNEGWGQFDANRISAMVKGWDPNRLIDHASGWHDQGAGDIFSMHKYFRPFVLKSDKHNRVPVLSEYGGYSRRCKAHCYSNKSFGYRMYETEEELSNAYKTLHETEILPAIENGLAAVVYTQVSDVEDEVNGIFTYDRAQLKINKEIIKTINEKLLNCDNKSVCEKKDYK